MQRVIGHVITKQKKKMKKKKKILKKTKQRKNKMSEWKIKNTMKGVKQE